jgi:hypothetical protein
MVSFQKKWQARNILIEHSNGRDLLEMELKRVAHKYNVPMPIYWIPVDNKLDAKANHIKGLETLLADDRLWFVIDAKWMDETILQFCNFTGERKTTRNKDDIPDAVSMHRFFVPPAPGEQTEEEVLEQQKEIEQQREMQAFYKHIFGPQNAPQPAARIIPAKRAIGGVPRRFSACR